MKKELNEKLKHYLALEYPMLISHDKADGIYIVQFPDLPGCMAHGPTPASALKLAKEIKREWIEDALESGQILPVPKNEEEYSGKFVVRIPRFLHKRLSEQADREGRSLNQHVGVLLSERSASLLVENSLDRLSKIEGRLQEHTAILKKHSGDLVKAVTRMAYLSSNRTSGYSTGANNLTTTSRNAKTVQLQ